METMRDGENKPEGETLPGDEDDQTTELANPATPPDENETVWAVRAEIDAVIETAGKVAHEGLAPNADGPRVLAGLVLQLAEQFARIVDGVSDGPTADRSPNEAEAPTEEDVTPEDAPADPPREI